MDEKVEKDVKRRRVLSPALDVAIQIYKSTVEDKEDVYYTKLVELLDGKVSSATINKALDSLLDIGILSAEWKKLGSNWARVFTVSNEGEDTIKSLYEYKKRGKL